MSIVALALRLAAKRLIDGATIAGAKVYDSAITSLDELVAKEPQPIITISTEDEQVSPTGRDILAGSRSLDLVIEIALASAMSVPLEDEQGEELQVAVPATDGGLELSLAIMDRQIMRALFHGPEPWSGIFRRLAPQVANILSRRGASATGTRFAARQIIMSIEPLADPAFGQAVEPGVWADFITALKADAELAPIAPLVEAAITGDPIDEWRLPASAIGLTDSEARGIGIFPVIEPAEDPAAVGSMEVEGLGEMTEADIERNLPDA